ncbi:odorant receptor 67c [Halyomorpha halys]|uniref:odorant receptor 67c n=1 Tax=Halyomorpha halys TaxID=286706 RepID=UPI0034D1F613
MRGTRMKYILDFVEGYVFVNDSYAKHIYLTSFYIIALTVLAYAIHPLISHSLPFYYETPWGSESFSAFASSYFVMFFDLYLIQFVSTINDFTYLMCADAICYRLNRVKSLLESIEGEEDEGKLIRAIKEHQDILRTLNMLADTISPNFFMQVFATLSIVIFSAFTAVTSNESQHFSACLSTLATLLTYCWLGQMVTNATEALHFAAYNNKWYNCNRRMKMNLQILSSFTREPFEIRGCSIVRMNLQTFKEVVTDSYSYLMILITMDDTS